MKRFFTAVLFAILSPLLFAATTTPVQLLNPTGSTAGQAILSTGASTAPTWGNVSAAALTGITPVANGGTGVNALTANSVIIGNGTSGVTFATIGTAGRLLTDNGVGVPPTFQPFSSGSITGVTNGSNAASGIVGEYLTNSTSGSSMTTNTPLNATSVPLTAGDWDVQCVAALAPAGGTSIGNYSVGIGTASATFGPVGANITVAATLTTGASQVNVTPVVRINSSSSSTAYCVVQAGFSGGTMTVTGVIRARRVR